MSVSLYIQGIWNSVSPDEVVREVFGSCFLGVIYVYRNTINKNHFLLWLSQSIYLYLHEYCLSVFLVLFSIFLRLLLNVWLIRRARCYSVSTNKSWCPFGIYYSFTPQPIYHFGLHKGDVASVFKTRQELTGTPETGKPSKNHVHRTLVYWRLCTQLIT